MFAAAPEPAAIVKAMLLGDRSFVDHDAAETFQKTGVYHVLVISGLHVAALAGFVFFAGRLLRLRQTLQVVLTVAALVAFVAVVEDRPPIERAALMAGVFLFSRIWFRRTELLNAIAVAAVVILAARPSALSDPSFQLSFLAVTMIGALALPWTERTTVPLRRGLAHVDDVTRDASHAPRIAQLRLDIRAAVGWIAQWLPRKLSSAATAAVVWPLRAGLRLWEIVLVSTAIQFGMLPLMAIYFHRVTLVGPLANIPAPLLSGLIVPVGFLAMGAGLISEALGEVLGQITEILIGAMVASVEWMGEWRWGAYRVPEPSPWLVAVFLALTVGLAWACRRRGAWLQWAFATPLMVCAVLIAVHPFAPNIAADALEVNVLDVGQGDSIFVAFPDGRTMVVDGGGTYGASRVGGTRTGLDIGEQVVSPYLWSRGLQRIDAVALTHAHQDHIDGLDAILENFRVGELWIGREVETPGFRALLERAKRRGVRIVQKHRGEAFEWGGVTGIALWPEDTGPVAAGANNDSLVLRLEYGSTSVLLPGDIEKKVELEMIARGDPLDVDLLKVPHHGSRTSSSSEFLQAVTPQAAVMSFGENNPFNHPHPELLQRLRQTGARVLRTDRDGAVRATSDGRAWRVRSYAETAPK
jgi:competence protein ComEC